MPTSPSFLHRLPVLILLMLAAPASAQVGATASGTDAIEIPAADAQPAAVPVPDLREQLAACAICHGEHGEGATEGGEYFPHLAGKPAGYLLAQMQAFRDGRRLYPRMVYLMQYMDDGWLGEIAHWYAAQPAHTQRVESTALDAAARARAETLVYSGDPERGLPACAACHGDRLTGVEPGIPALVGLPTDYLIAQLGGWITGARSSKAPDCMADIARRIDPVDIRLVSTWLAGQSAAPGERPLPAGSVEPPMPCGSLTAAHDPAVTTEASP
ncbi:c-type cytochrome [Pseudofulvimonas gallinarii]|jgi:cytochrome c553|uniref:Cytochrome c553 n=2 Tax=Pseudofulvimonas gallinarii TaxID=634155 RepID=A0A4R3LN10_9GAMM|nr:c-type cytochrome [Pseudofulvimonas gallinarii]TCS99266.1 cytochrome c553 [Pseudofulvimonas gallinarii]